MVQSDANQVLVEAGVLLGEIVELVGEDVTGHWVWGMRIGNLFGWWRSLVCGIIGWGLEWSLIIVCKREQFNLIQWMSELSKAQYMSIYKWTWIKNNKLDQFINVLAIFIKIK